MRRSRASNIGELQKTMMRRTASTAAMKLSERWYDRERDDP